MSKEGPGHLNFRVDPALAAVLRGYAEHFERPLGRELAYASQAWACLLMLEMTRNPGARSASPEPDADLDRLREQAEAELREILHEATRRPAPPPLEAFAGRARAAS